MRNDCRICRFQSACGYDFAPDEGVCPGGGHVFAPITPTTAPAGFKRGIYRTDYGNAAYVSGPNAKSAYDLDMAERVPIQMVTTEWIRAAEPRDAH